MARSKYEEDVFSNNHTAVWGSYFDRTTMRWGYADDLSTVRHSYGTGAAGKRARQQAIARQQAAGEEEAAAAAAGAAGASSALEGRGTSSTAPANAMFGMGEELQNAELDEAKVKAAIKAQRKRESKEGAETESDDRKRKYNSGASYEVSAEEMEAYHRLKKRDTTGDMADPMANFKDVV